jgi:vacuolar-type H+-ATPase subunit E/Vma4|tara:strand:+ start:521 stop:1078 length:558 start_codon:yes stop_codon:yes gene_type:complete
MTLEVLANEIAAQAEAEAKSIIAAAHEQAMKIESEAKEQAERLDSDLQSRAERESAQTSVEIVASARQANQKRELISKREVLDKTWEEVRHAVGSRDFNQRSKILSKLLSETKGSDNNMILRPVAIDRDELKDAPFKIGADVQGLGGFLLESSDGSIVLDYLFDSRLEMAWKNNLASINEVLFGN